MIRATKASSETRGLLWKDDLLHALIGLARVEIGLGNHVDARKSLEEAVAIGRDLSKQLGDRDQRVLNNLQMGLGYLGDTYIALKMPAAARAVFEERLLVRRRLLAAFPTDPLRLTAVSTALDRVGQLIRDDGDPGGSLKISVRLSPSTVSW